MLGSLLGTGLKDVEVGAVVSAAVVLILGLVALIRCNKKDIPAIVRALMGIGPRDDDSGKTPPSLPKP
jgi:hypothetical protein